jgi:hypothetical protein
MVHEMADSDEQDQVEHPRLLAQYEKLRSAM